MIRTLALAAALAASALGADALAQGYPARPVRLVVGFAPGGAADTVGRALAGGLSRELGQPIVIENRAGAGSSIAADNVAKSPPDGYSVLIASPAAISVNPALNPKLPYKPSDLVPIAKVSASPLVIVVNPATGITSVKELIAAATKAPGALNYATSGIGASSFLAAELFRSMMRADLVRVNYKSGGLALTEMISGQV